MAGLLGKIKAGWNVVKAGQIVANPVAWKRGQITVVYLATLLSAMVAFGKAFGYEIPLTEEQLSAIATSILAVVGVFNHFATAASTNKISITGREIVYGVDTPDRRNAPTSDSGLSGQGDTIKASTQLPNSISTSRGSNTVFKEDSDYEQRRSRDSEGG